MSPEHRRGCDVPPPTGTTTTLSDGQRIRIDRCDTCGAVAIHREDT